MYICIERLTLRRFRLVPPLAAFCARRSAQASFFVPVVRGIVWWVFEDDALYTYLYTCMYICLRVTGLWPPPPPSKLDRSLTDCIFMQFH